MIDIDPPVGHYLSDTPYVIVHFQERSPNIIKLKVYKARYAEVDHYYAESTFIFHVIKPRSVLKIQRTNIQNGQYKIYENNERLHKLSEEQITNIIVDIMFGELWKDDPLKINRDTGEFEIK